MKTVHAAIIAMALLVVPYMLHAQTKGAAYPESREKNLTIPPDITAQPDGGFLEDIQGTWDCGEMGTVVLQQNGEKVTGTYGEDGKITGTLRKNRFTGTWSEAGGKSKGRFDFKTSIERKTNRPTNLRGKWKNAGEKNWQAAAWECSN